MPNAQRDFYKLWVGQTISEIGSRITREGLPLTAVLMLGASPAQMGVLAATGSASILAFSVAAGVIADRMRRRPLMIWTDLARAALLATIPMAASWGVLSFPLLVGVAVLAGILTVQFDVAYQSYLPSLLPESDLLRGNRRLGMSTATAEILGPSLTGILIQALTAPIAILLDAISFVISAVSVWIIGTPEAKPERRAHASIASEAIEGARAIAHHPVLRALALRSIVAYLSMGVMFSLYVLYAMRTLKMSTPVFGLTIALGGAGALVGAYFSERVSRWMGVGPAFFTTALVTATVNLLVPLAASVPEYAVLCMASAQFFGDGAWAIYAVNETTLRQRSVPGEVLGRVNAAMQLASRGMLPLGALAGGLIAERYSIPHALWTGAIGLLLSCALLLPVRGHTGESRRPPQHP
jgi:predicted MFS family arabinose efflux permease